MKTFTHSRAGAGFTLIEVVMVITIVGIIGTGILMYFMGLRSGGDLTTYNQATLLAQAEMEKVRADKQANGFSSIVAAAPSALPSPFGKFTREVEVYCVQESDLNANSGTMPDCNDSDIRSKRVRVIITWAGGSADFVTVISNH